MVKKVRKIVNAAKTVIKATAAEAGKLMLEGAYNRYVLAARQAAEKKTEKKKSKKK